MTCDSQADLVYLRSLLLGTSKSGAAILDRVTVLVALLFEAEEEEPEQVEEEGGKHPAPDFFAVS